MMESTHTIPLYTPAVDSDDTDKKSRRMLGLGLVVAVHLLAGYAILNGLARPPAHVVQTRPVQVTLVPVRKPPPPHEPIQIATAPPPPPEPVKAAAPPIARPQSVSKTPRPTPPVPRPLAPVATQETAAPISSSPATPIAAAAPAVAAAPTAPAAPAAPSAPAAPAAPRKIDAAVACHQQVSPVLPAKALAEGIGGVVKAQALIRNGQVEEVTILSGNKVFHTAVRAAMLQYKCADHPGQDMIAMQQFHFEVE